MQKKRPPTPTNKAAEAALGKAAPSEAIRGYVRTYARWHGRLQTARHFGVSRHTLVSCFGLQR